MLALLDINTQLHEHVATAHGIADLRLAQNRDTHILALKRLLNKESLPDSLFPMDVREFARRYFHQKKDHLFVNQDEILCLRYTQEQRAIHSRPCMIVMPQLYQKEILYNAHDKVGHQGIAKVLQRIQERHTWPGIRKDITEYIKRCYTCQEVRHPAGNQCYPLQSITSSGFNDLVQFDHMKVCKSDSGNSGLLVIIDHFSKFAEAVPCAYDQYDAISTAESLLTKWVARHGTPTRMQSDNAAAFNSVIMNHFMAASHVTKVSSTPGHPRGNGLVERQNRTLLTLLRVFTTRRMQSWDKHLDEVLGAYNSTRHATTGFSPYMLTHGMEKSIPCRFYIQSLPPRSSNPTKHSYKTW